MSSNVDREIKSKLEPPVPLIEAEFKPEAVFASMSLRIKLEPEAKVDPMPLRLELVTTLINKSSSIQHFVLDITG